MRYNYREQWTERYLSPGNQNESVQHRDRRRRQWVVLGWWRGHEWCVYRRRLQSHWTLGILWSGWVRRQSRCRCYQRYIEDKFCSSHTDCWTTVWLNCCDHCYIEMWLLNLVQLLCSTVCAPESTLYLLMIHVGWQVTIIYWLRRSSQTDIHTCKKR